jgi:hypothetical protein
MDVTMTRTARTACQLLTKGKLPTSEDRVSALRPLGETGLQANDLRAKIHFLRHVSDDQLEVNDLLSPLPNARSCPARL